MLKITSNTIFKTIKVNQLQCLRAYGTLKTATVDSKQFKQSQWDQALPYNQIPGPKSLLDLRHFLPGGKYTDISLGDLHRKLRDEYGQIVLLKGMLRRPDFVMIYDPADFELLHRTEGQWPIRNGGMEIVSRYRNGDNKPDFYKDTGGLVVEQGEGWAKFRNRVNPVMMQPKIAKQYVPQIDQIAIEFSEKIRKDRNSNGVMMDTFGGEIFKWALESIASIALEQKLGLLSDESNPDGIALINYVRLFFDLSYKLEIEASLWRYFETPLYKKQIKNLENLTALVSKMLDSSVKALEEGDNDLGGEQSVLKKLIQIDRSTGYVMATDMLTAGADTTGSLATGLLFALAKNPEKQQKLREEILTLLPDKNSILEAESLYNIPYLRATIKEASRLHPVTTGNVRAAGQDLILKGYQVPKGVNVATGNILAHFDEKQYPKPLSFIPERWIKNRTETSEIDSNVAHPFSFLPFGFGARMCIGRRFAELEVECLVARLVRNYYIGWNGKEDIKYKSDFINSPTGPVPFVFKDVEY